MYVNPDKRLFGFTCRQIQAADNVMLDWYVQTVQEVFCWSRNPMEVRRLTARKEEIYRQLLGDRTPLVPSGVRHLIDVLGKHQACSSFGLL